MPKRTLDLLLVIGSAPAILLLATGAAVSILLDTGGPVLFRQTRVGRGGIPFTMLKFRTMVHSQTGNPLFPEPSAITRVGRVLRRTSLDELPQFWNIIRGEMSIVGPRPTLPYQVERYDARQRRRLLVRPGITGLAQVRGRNGLSWSQRIEHDLQYVANQSLYLDLKIMLSTLRVVVVGAGVHGHPEDDPIASEPKL